MNDELFSKRLKEARKRKDLTQKQLADITGISVTTLTNYETRKATSPTADNLISLSNALEVSIDWLLGKDAIEKGKQETNKFDLKTILYVFKYCQENGIIGKVYEKVYDEDLPFDEYNLEVKSKNFYDILKNIEKLTEIYLQGLLSKELYDNAVSGVINKADEDFEVYYSEEFDCVPGKLPF